VSIQLPRQPTGPGQACYKCGAYFVHCASNPRGRQCKTCRNKTKSKNPARGRVKTRTDRPWAAVNSAHTQAWYERELGQAEHRILGHALARPLAHYATENCDGLDTVL